MSSDSEWKRELLVQQIEEASKPISPLWPLSTAINLNPLWDLRHMKFREAILYARKIFGISGYPQRKTLAKAYSSGRITAADLKASYEGYVSTSAVTKSLQEERQDLTILTTAERHDWLYGTQIALTTDREVAKWCAAYTSNLLPYAGDGGFYPTWRNIVISDPAASQLLGKSGRRHLATLADQPIDVILESLEKLGVGDKEVVPELSRQLARMPGWAGYAKWRSVWGEENLSKPAPQLIDYLAVRLAYDAELIGSRLSKDSSNIIARNLIDKKTSSKHIKYIEEPLAIPDAVELTQKIALLSELEADEIWLRSYENHYRDSLLTSLSSQDQKAGSISPVVQAIFCIDVRSERIRRHLEEAGPYETFGFAGFFGLPISFRPWGTEETVSLCPVFAHPNAIVTEKPVESAYQTALRELSGTRALEAAANSFNAIRKGGMSSFFTAEIGGFFMGPAAMLKTVFPLQYVTLRKWLNQKLAPHAETVIDMSPTEIGMSDEEQALLVESLLLSIGLTRNFAKIILLCGHGSTTENNPYASMLDCGACGAQRGGVSARTAAAVFNRRKIRSLLAEKGILIPKDTFFIAAEHDTVTDKVNILDPHLIPAEYLDMLTVLRGDLEIAARKSVAERLADLPGHSKKDPLKESIFRSYDWAQVRPEWGASRNAAFIIAPRKLTAGINLEGRCFLHSYDAEADSEGTMLESILSGPVVVAHWINAQYYFSTVDPDKFSAGDKTVHNIISGIGVTEGNGFDLKIGLPLQSLFFNGEEYHEPMRLLVVVQAAKTCLDEIITRNTMIAELLDGEWIHLVARDDENDDWKVRQPGGKWELWTPCIPDSIQ